MSTKSPAGVPVNPETKKDESGPKVAEATKSRAERFAEAQARVLENHAETFRKLAQ
jgi:hypothetical protein